MNQGVHILLVEDDPDFSELIAGTLRKHSYSVTAAYSAGECRDELRKKVPDLLVLDLNLPDENGLNLCMSISKQYAMPIIVLTGVTTDIEKIMALGLGVSNYLTKPINPLVLVAYIQACLHQAKSNVKEAIEKGESIKIFHDILTFDRFIINTSTRALQTTDGKEIPLTSGEFEVLLYFALHPQQVISRNTLLNMRDVSSENFDRSIDIFITRIRKKIEKDQKNPQLLKTVRGSGYIFSTAVQKKKIEKTV